MYGTLTASHLCVPESPSLYVPDDSVNHASVMKSQVSAQKKSLVELPGWRKQSCARLHVDDGTPYDALVPGEGREAPCSGPPPILPYVLLLLVIRSMSFTTVLSSVRYSRE